MAWTTPRSWIPGELTTAALLNTHVRDNLDALNDLIPHNIHDATYNDGSGHSVADVHNQSGRVIIITTGGATVIPFYANGGAGVAWRWTALDPDTGWIINSATISMSFVDGSNLNTYTVAFSNGSGAVTVTRTAGTTAYRLIVSLDLLP